MNRGNLVIIGAACFFAGIAFVVACGDMTGAPDAGRDAIGIPDALGQITPMQVYQVESRQTIESGVGQELGAWSVAKCGEGDILLGGGCWVYHKDDTFYQTVYRYRHSAVAFGPAAKPPNGELDATAADKRQYYCLYENLDNDPDMVVVARAICYDANP